MPLYEYKCESCGTKFEEIRASYDENPVPCPECEGAAQKTISRFALRTGTGFSFGGGCSSGGG